MSVPTSKRAARLAALACATVLLAVGVWVARDGLQQLAFERREAATAAARVGALRNAMPEVLKREEYARLAVQARQAAAQLGFDPAGWAERRINRGATPVSRTEAAELLRQMGSGGGERFFAADSFELAVLSREAGLFTPPAADDKGFVLAVNGTLYFPLAPKP